LKDETNASRALFAIVDVVLRFGGGGEKKFASQTKQSRQAAFARRRAMRGESDHEG